VRGTTLGAWLALAGLCGSAGCAQHAGSQATSGALQSLSAGIREAEEDEQLSTIVAGRAVQGAVSKLSEPEQLAALRLVVGATTDAALARAFAAFLEAGPGGVSPLERMGAAMAGGFRDTMVSGLSRDLGEAGPLAASLGGTAYRTAARATDGAVERLFPGCRADDPSCLDHRVAALSREAAAGFGRGLRESLGLPVLVLAFLAGVVVTLMVMLTIRLEVRRREPHRTPRAAPAS
jgi:hypothetical protein